jgi:hypothetical protein
MKNHNHHEVAMAKWTHWQIAVDEKHGSFKITSCMNVVIQSIAKTIQNFNKAPPMMIMLLLLLGIQHWLVSRWLAYVLLICCDVDDCCFLWHVSWLLLCFWIAASWRVSWLLLCFWTVAFGRVSWSTTIDAFLQVTVVFNCVLTSIALLCSMVLQSYTRCRSCWWHCGGWDFVWISEGGGKGSSWSFGHGGVRWGHWCNDIMCLEQCVWDSRWLHFCHCVVQLLLTCKCECFVDLELACSWISVL